MDYFTHDHVVQWSIIERLAPAGLALARRERLTAEAAARRVIMEAIGSPERSLNFELLRGLLLLRLEIDAPYIADVLGPEFHKRVNALTSGSQVIDISDHRMLLERFVATEIRLLDAQLS